MSGSPILPPPEAPARPRVLVAGIGGICALLGSLVLIGWHMRLTALIQSAGDFQPTHYNTGVCLLLAGLAFGTWSCRRMPWAVPAFGALILAVGGIRLTEYFFHVDLGIDRALFRPSTAPGIPPAGRMPVLCAFCFTLAGLSLLALSIRPGSRWRAAAAGSVASIILSLSFSALASYAFGVPAIQGWGNLTRIAAQSASGLGLVGAGILIVAWSSSCTGGERTPRWLPVALALGTFTGSLVLYCALQEKQDEDAAQTVKFGAERAVNEITSHIESRIRVFAHMAQLWEFYGAPTQALFEDDSHDYLRRSPDIQSLEWVDRAYQTRWIVPAPRTGAKNSPDLMPDPRQRAAMDQAEHDHQPVISRLVTLPDGDPGFVVYVPLIINSRPDGFIAASFSAHSSLRRYLPPHIADGESIELYDGGRLFYSRDAAPENGRPDLIEQNIDLAGVTWRLLMWPTPVLAARLNSPLPTVVLSAGVIFSFLLGGVCFFAQRSSRQAAETRRSNAALQAALDTVKTLEGLLPICSSCKRVRDDTGYWSQIDTYLGKNTNASLSHGYCPECAAKAFQEFGFEVPEAVQAAVAAGNFEEHHHPVQAKA